MKRDLMGKSILAQGHAFSWTLSWFPSWLFPLLDRQSIINIAIQQSRLITPDETAIDKTAKIIKNIVAICYIIYSSFIR